MSKKILIFALALVMMFSIFALGSSEAGTTEQGAGTTDQGTGTTEQGNTDDSSIGDYSLEILSARQAKDYSGKDVIIIKYKFTNVKNDDATAFYLAFEDRAYQNGVGLNESILLPDSANYDNGNQMKEIKKGASLELEVAYELDDTTTDVVVEVKEYFSFSDKTITKTFSFN